VSRRWRPTDSREPPCCQRAEPIGPPALVARMIWSRLPGSQRPTISSVRPTSAPMG
jgi:hypothetical protein